MLEAHETELARLRARYQQMEPMLGMIVNHVTLLRQIVDFVAEASDKDRLTSRARRDPGRLLREEKFRNNMARDVPKVRRRARWTMARLCSPPTVADVACTTCTARGRGRPPG